MTLLDLTREAIANRDPNRELTPERAAQLAALMRRAQAEAARQQAA